MPEFTLCLPPARWGPRKADPVQWQYCQFSMYFFQFNQNSTIHTDLEVNQPLSSTCSPPTPEHRFPVYWQYCHISVDFFQFYQSSTIYADFLVILPFQRRFYPFLSHTLAGDPGPSSLNAMIILPDFDGFLPISSKLDHFFRFSRHPSNTNFDPLSLTGSLKTHCLRFTG